MPTAKVGIFLGCFDIFAICVSFLMPDRGQVFVKNLGHFWLWTSSHIVEPSAFSVGRSLVA
jgi:hypothetical protein